MNHRLKIQVVKLQEKIDKDDLIIENNIRKASESDCWHYFCIFAYVSMGMDIYIIKERSLYNHCTRRLKTN